MMETMICLIFSVFFIYRGLNAFASSKYFAFRRARRFRKQSYAQLFGRCWILCGLLVFTASFSNSSNSIKIIVFIILSIDLLAEFVSVDDIKS